MACRPFAPPIWLGIPLLGLIVACGSSRIRLPVAFDELQAQVQAEPYDPSAHYNMALGYWSKGRYDEAEAELREAIAIDPHFPDAYLALAFLPFARRPSLWREIYEDRVPEEWRPILDESDSHYRHAFLLDPLVDLRIIGAAVPTSPFPSPLIEGRYEDAYRSVDRFFESWGGPDSEDVPIGLLWSHSVAAAHVGEYEEAIADLELLLQRTAAKGYADSLVYNPLRRNEYRYLLASLYHRTDRLDDAVRLYRESLTADLGLYMAHVQLARIQLELGEFEAAVEECRRALQIKPADPALLMELGRALRRAGRRAEAEEVLSQAMALNPRDARIPYILGIVQLERGEVEEGRKTLQRFLTRAPSRWQEQIEGAERLLDRLGRTQ